MINTALSGLENNKLFIDLTEAIKKFWINTYSDIVQYSKEPNSAVTSAIRSLDGILRNKLQDVVPGSGYFSDFTHIVAPVANWHVVLNDNVENYLTGGKNFGCSITLVHNGKIEIGCIILPKYDMSYVGYRDGGVYLNNEPFTYHRRYNWHRSVCVHSLDQYRKYTLQKIIGNEFGKSIVDSQSFLTEIVRVLVGESSLLLGDRIPFSLYSAGQVIFKELDISFGGIKNQEEWDSPLSIFFSGYNTISSDFVIDMDHYLTLYDREIRDGNTTEIWIDKETCYQYSKLRHSTNVIQGSLLEEMMETGILGTHIALFEEVFA